MRPLHLVAIAVVLVATLAIKVATGPSVAAIPEPDREAPIGAFLARHGFALQAERTETEPPMLVADSGACEIRVTEVSPFGWHRHVLAQLARPGETTAFVFKGNVYAGQPLWRTALDHNWRRLVSYSGLTLPRHPVLGLVASDSCDLEGLPWQELADLT
jgi:hypothetical protein